MKTLLMFALFLFAAATTASAQVAQATPPPDPHVFSDAAMTFTAPPDAVLVGRQDVTDPDHLGQDLQTVAAWVLDPNKENARTIQLAMEDYTGPPSDWEGQFESQTHGSQDGTLIRNRTPMTLLNGMPATFVEIAFGSGFDSRKQYAVVWADGQRGIVLSETARLGDTDADQAKRVLRQVTAVAYPMYQP
jgi:opacity protein-like surface antigen